MPNKKMLIVGFWAPGTDEEGFMYPPIEHFILRGWYKSHNQDLETLLSYLSRGRVHKTHRNARRCLLCGKDLGNETMTDGVWLWPAGLAHYIEAHDVLPSVRFQQYARKMLDILTDASALPSVLEQKHKNPEGVAHTAVTLINQLFKCNNASEYAVFKDAYESLKQMSSAYETVALESVDLGLRLGHPSS